MRVLLINVSFTIFVIALIALVIEYYEFFRSQKRTGNRQSVDYFTSVLNRPTGTLVD